MYGAGNTALEEILIRASNTPIKLNKVCSGQSLGVIMNNTITMSPKIPGHIP
jgi:hypothetical protein